MNIKYLAGIDALRAIAVLAVIVFHLDSSFLLGGFTGVDVFFVISGYVISKSLAQHTSSAFLPYILGFYKRRVIRILPALLVFLVIISLASSLFIPTAWLSVTSSKTGLGAFWGISNYMLLWYTDGYFSPQVEFNPFVHTWSLAVEEQFYLFFPFLFYIWHRFQQKKDIISFFLRSLLAILAVISLFYAVYETTANHDQAFYLLPSRFWELAAGALLFKLHQNKVSFTGAKYSASLFLGFGSLLLLLGFLYSVKEQFPFPWAIAPVLGTLLLIHGIVIKAQAEVQASAYANSDKDKLKLGLLFPLQRLLEAGVLNYIGKISYSLYLWHWGIYVLFRWTIGLDSLLKILFALLLTFAFAIASYHLIESPIRTYYSFRQGKNWKVIMLSLLIVAGSYFLADKIFKEQPALSLSVTRDKAVWYPDPQENIKLSVDDFLLQKELRGRKLFVVGDSHTMAYSTMLHEISVRLGIEVYKYPTGHCRPMNLLFSATLSDDCKNRVNNVFATIKELSNTGDIVFFASLRVNRLCDQWDIIDIDRVIRIQHNEKSKLDQKLALKQASEIIDMLTKAGLKVLIDLPKPIFKAPPFRCSDWFNQSNPICKAGMSIERQFLLEHRQSVVQSIQILKARHANVFVWDPFPVLCQGEICSAFNGNKPLFFDGDHLSGYGNQVLIPSFKKKIFNVFTAY